MTYCAIRVERRNVYGMSRLPSDESGPARTVSVRLSPRHIAMLDEMAGARAMNRSQLVTKLIERAERGTHPSQSGEVVAHHGDGSVTLASVSPIVSGGVTLGQTAEHVAQHAFAINACVHRNITKLATGLHRCRDCNGTKGNDGVWR